MVTLSVSLVHLLSTPAVGLPEIFPILSSSWVYCQGLDLGTSVCKEDALPLELLKTSCLHRKQDLLSFEEV